MQVDLKKEKNTCKFAKKYKEKKREKTQIYSATFFHLHFFSSITTHTYIIFLPSESEWKKEWNINRQTAQAGEKKNIVHTVNQRMLVIWIQSSWFSEELVLAGYWFPVFSICFCVKPNTIIEKKEQEHVPCSSFPSRVFHQKYRNMAGTCFFGAGKKISIQSCLLYYVGVDGRILYSLLLSNCERHEIS